MGTRVVKLAVALALAAGLAAWGQDGGEVVREREEERAEKREFLRHAAEGMLHEEEAIEQLERRLGGSLLRPRLGLGQKARYTLAEIHLRKRRYEKSAEQLRKIIVARAKPDEVVWVTRYNLARILRRDLKQSEKALAEYEKVEGHLQPLARREAERMLRDEMQFARLSQVLEHWLAAAKDDGERFALMLKLGKLYQRTGEGGKGVRLLERVAEEATPKKMKALREALRGRVRKAVVEIKALRRKDRWRQAEERQRDLWRELAKLRLQGREEEAHVLAEALASAERQLEADAERHEREERGRGKED